MDREREREGGGGRGGKEDGQRDRMKRLWTDMRKDGVNIKGLQGLRERRDTRMEG